MNCRKIALALSSFMDDDRDPAVCRWIERHLPECRPCQKFYKSLKNTIYAVRRQPRAAVPKKLSNALHEELRRNSQ